MAMGGSILFVRSSVTFPPPLCSSLVFSFTPFYSHIFEVSGFSPPRTLAELHKSKHLVNMRRKPYLRLGVWLGELERQREEANMSAFLS